MTTPIKFIQWNARGLYKSRLEEFKINLRSYDPHFVILSETHCKDEYKLKFWAYKSFFLNRPTQGGGAAILAKKNIRTTQLVIAPSNNLEVIGVTMSLSNMKEIDIVSVYGPDGNSCGYEEIENLLNSTGRSAIVCGD